MGGSTLLNLLVLLPFEHLSEAAWRLAAVAFAIQVLAVVFSLVGLVPINNRIAKFGFAVNSCLQLWRAQEHRWDQYHGLDERAAAL